MRFFSVMPVFYFLGWIYIAWRINSGLKIRKPYNIYLFAACLVIAILGITAFSAARSSVNFISAAASFGYICMGFLGITFTVFVLNDIINIANLFLKIKQFRYYSTIASLAASAVLSAWALLNAAFVLHVKNINIKVPNLPAETLKIAQISDLHINKFTSYERIKKIIKKVEALNPDIIVITGDVLDTDINRNGEFYKYGFENLDAPCGVYAVTGNHERRRLSAFYEMCEKLGIKALKGESVIAADMINIAGINDSDWQNEKQIKKALASVSPEYPVLFLSHRPETFDAAAAQGVRIIQLSGHTHAGQIPPVEVVRKFFMKYNYGFYAIGDSVMYVTSGTRWWGPPMRTFSFCEIANITLERE